MTTEERFETLEHDLAHAARCNRWLLAAVALVAATWIAAWAPAAAGRSAT